jgi:hypothetical protein
VQIGLAQTAGLGGRNREMSDNAGEWVILGIAANLRFCKKGYCLFGGSAV